MQAINLFEFGNYHLFPSNQIVDLKNYLEEVWKQRNSSINIKDEIEQELNEEDEAAFKRSKQRFITFDGNYLRGRNYVGFIHFEGQRINIYPKICRDFVSPNQIFSNVLYWLSYSKRIKFPFTQLPLDKQTFDDWIEVLIYLFANHTEQTLSSQPYQAYQEVTEETSFLKGKLAISEYIQSNLSRGRNQYFYCTYEPFLFDNQFNRIVKFVTRMLLTVSINSVSKDKLHTILFLLNEVSDESYNAKDCDLVKLNPLYHDLNIVLDMCRMFLESATINNGDNSNNNFCFLLPMEVIFEDYIFGFIEKHFPETNPKSQSLSWLTNENTFLLKTDIILESPKLIIDTKYKIRDTDIDNKKGISQSDMYQMLAYAYRRGISEVLLVYPAIKPTEASYFTITDNLGSSSKIKITAHDFDIRHDGNYLEIEQRLKNQMDEIFNQF